MLPRKASLELPPAGLVIALKANASALIISARGGDSERRESKLQICTGKPNRLRPSCVASARFSRFWRRFGQLAHTANLSRRHRARRASLPLLPDVVDVYELHRVRVNWSKLAGRLALFGAAHRANEIQAPTGLPLADALRRGGIWRLVLLSQLRAAAIRDLLASRDRNVARAKR